tara:strand:+ start:1050 stop:1184 length:135 start_codon:yes stop_codon:yes gene_type:complete
MFGAVMLLDPGQPQPPLFLVVEHAEIILKISSKIKNVKIDFFIL